MLVHIKGTQVYSGRLPGGEPQLSLFPIALRCITGTRLLILEDLGDERAASLEELVDEPVSRGRLQVGRLGLVIASGFLGVDNGRLLVAVVVVDSVSHDGFGSVDHTLSVVSLDDFGDSSSRFRALALVRRGAQVFCGVE